MNIFLFNKDLYKSASFFFAIDFKRANKQILESTQMIAIACEHFRIQKPISSETNEEYKTAAYCNHPCTLWTKQTVNHFYWHWMYVNYHCVVYEELTEKEHGCAKALSHCEEDMEYIWDNAWAWRLVKNEFWGKEEFCEGIKGSDSVYIKYLKYLTNKQHKKINGI